MKIKRLLAATLFTSLFLIACQGKEEQQLAIPQAVTDDGVYQGKDWTLKNLAGESITLSDSKGKPTLLIFWATWCPYCKKLLPGIEELHEKYASKGLKILAVDINEDGSPWDYWKQHGYQFDALVEGDDVAKIYGVSGTPGIVFIAPSGKVLGVQSFSDPHHPLLERFAKEGLALMNK